MKHRNQVLQKVEQLAEEQQWKSALELLPYLKKQCSAEENWESLVWTCFYEGRCYQELSQNDRVLIKYKTAADLFDTYLDKQEQKTLFWKIHYHWAFYFYDMGQNQEGIEKAEWLQAECLQFFGEMHENTGLTYEMAGYLYTSLGSSKSAVASFKKADIIFDTVFGVPNKYKGAIKNGLTRLYSLLHDKKRTLQCAKDAMDYAVQYESKESHIYVNTALNFAVIMGSPHFNPNLNMVIAKRSLEVLLELETNNILHRNASFRAFLGTIYYNIAMAYRRWNNLLKSLVYHKKSITYNKAHFGNQSPKLLLSYIALTQISLSLRDYYMAKQYLIQAMKIIDAKDNILSLDKVRIYSMYSEVYEAKKKYAKAIQLNKQALQYSLSIELNNKEYAITCLLNLTEIYLSQKNYSLAQKNALKAIDLCQSMDAVIQLQLLLAYSFISLIALKEGKHEEAQNAYQQVVTNLNEVHVFGNVMSRKIKILENLAQYCLQNKEQEQALLFFHKLLVLMLPEVSIILEEPPVLLAKQAAQNLHISKVAKVILEKAKIFEGIYGNQNKEIRYLQAAYKHYQTSSRLMYEATQNMQANISKLFFRDNHNRAFDGWVNTSYWLYEKGEELDTLQEVFCAIEEAKAQLLLQNLELDKLAKHLGIPEEVIEKERKLKVQIAYLQKQISEAKQSEKGISQVDVESQQNDLFDFEQQVERLQKQIQSEYADYHAFRQVKQAITLPELQTALEDTQVVLQYYISQHTIYLFCVTNQTVELVATPKPANWHSLIGSYANAINRNQKETFLPTSFELYQLLLQPIEEELIDPFGEAMKEVFIITHNELNTIPFDSLLSQPVRNNTLPWSKLPYLINDVAIAYHYSATLLHEHLTTGGEQAPPDVAFTGFAPVYIGAADRITTLPLDTINEQQAWVTRSEAMREDGTWQPLVYSEEEVQNIATLFEAAGQKVQIQLHDSANKANFESLAQRSRFLLIAAHGIVNEDYPDLSGLVFFPKKQKIRETQRQNRGNESKEAKRSIERDTVVSEGLADYMMNMTEVANLRLDADLVVLSSCESGVGKLYKGEGMMAVNRGFLLGGAKNVISTLFKVFDQSSSQLTQKLFEEVLAGKSYVHALRNAKLALLQQANRDIVPQAWCSFVLFGSGR